MQYYYFIRLSSLNSMIMKDQGLIKVKIINTGFIKDFKSDLNMYTLV